jgi:hypothetical protein
MFAVRWFMMRVRPFLRQRTSGTITANKRLLFAISGGPPAIRAVPGSSRYELPGSSKCGKVIRHG